MGCNVCSIDLATGIAAWDGAPVIATRFGWNQPANGAWMGLVAEAQAGSQMIMQVRTVFEINEPACS